jgi:outer membrane protein assembly factor BamB
VLTESRVFLTAFDDGKLYTQCFDRATGEMLWERFEPRSRQEIANLLNEPAANSPVTGGENVYAFFRDFGLVSYDRAGKVRWKLPLGPFTNSMGNAASLILSGNSVILLADQEEDAYIASYRTSNGELNWKTKRGSVVGWSTPLLYQPAGGEPQIVTATMSQLNAHSATTGEPAWVHLGTSPAVAPSPVMLGDTVYSFGYGIETPQPLAPQLAEFDQDRDGRISPAEYGDDAMLAMVGRYYGAADKYVTQEAWDNFFRIANKPSALVAVRLDPATMEPHEMWRYERSFVGVVPSPILIGGILYLVKNGGILTSFNAETGEVIKAGRVTGAVDPYSASPVSAEGRIYFATEAGNVAVVEAGRDWSVATINALDEPMYATPALSQGHIYVRTDAALYSFGDLQ